MSFILDALKKADAERQLGELPGLRTAPLPRAPAEAARRARPWPLLASGAGAVAVLACAAYFMGPWRAGRPTQEIVAAPPAATVPARVPDRPTAGMPDGVADDIPTPPALPKKTVETPAPRHASAPAPAKPAGATGAPSPSSRPALAANAPALQARTTARPTPGNAGPGPAMTMAELPPAIRSQLPTLAIGGSMYSRNPADRMLLVDKRMLHEGDEIAPGLLLEAIQPKGALLRFRGYLFRVAL